MTSEELGLQLRAENVIIPGKLVPQLGKYFGVGRVASIYIE